ncbi:MAG TPA: hypothetical protein VMT82_10620 [candidate division Zixibacteria bacterium]|nr:hypothetical protein [candidate division Zixibacteria bacterium]
MRGNSLRHNHGGWASWKPVALTKFVDTVRERDREWVARFGRGLLLAALVSGLLWVAIVLILRHFF